MRKYIMLAILVIVQYSLEAQTLKRKGRLGIMMQALNDSVLAQNNLKINDGVLITFVVPNSTFSRLGIKQGDILTRLNDKPIASIQDVLSIR